MINPEELKIRDNDGTNKKIAMDIRDNAKWRVMLLTLLSICMTWLNSSDQSFFGCSFVESIKDITASQSGPLSYSKATILGGLF